MHIMSVKEKYYNMLKNGTKTIELRLFDDKRKQIMINDIVEFYNGSDENDRFKAIVIKLHKADSFEELCNFIKATQAGFENNEDLVLVLKEFYPLSKQNKIGVVGIEISRINF